MSSATKKPKLSIYEMCIFAVLGTVMFVTKFHMEAIPNVHLLGMLITAFTLTYRARALVPLYLYIMLDGLIHSFNAWWIPYLYIWLPLWGGVMLVSRIKMKDGIAAVVYMLLCGLHGLSFGALYAPFQALYMGWSLKATLAWIQFGLPFDIIHSISNFCIASLTLPLYALLRRLKKSYS